MDESHLSRRWLWLVPAVACGAALRLANLGGQILGGDEIHTLRATLTLPVSDLLVTFRLADFCKPLAAFYRLLLNLGVALSETHLRLPVLAASIATLVVLPWLVARHVGRRTALVFAWLLALSPMLVLYGRLVRAYGFMILLAGVAVVAFYRWWRRPSMVAASTYVVTASAAIYFHLLAGFMVAAPFAFALFDKLTYPRQRPKWRAMFYLGLAAALPTVLSLALSWDSLSQVMKFQSEGPSPKLGVVWPILSQQAGSSHSATVVLFWLVVVWGWWRLVQQHRRLAVYTLVVVLAQLAGLLITAPRGLREPEIFNRYLLVTLPLFLLWAAFGLAAPWKSSFLGSRRRLVPRLQWTFVGALGVALFATGPFANGDYYRTSWTQHQDSLRLYTPPPQTSIPELAQLYSRLKESGGPGALIEFPYQTSWSASKTPPIYEKLHGRRVVASTLEATLNDARLDLKNYVRPHAAEFLKSRARFLVVHLDREEEEAGPQKSRWNRRQGRVAQWRWQRQREAAWHMLRNLLRWWGPPDFQHRLVCAWDLERVRQVLSRNRPDREARRGLVCDSKDPNLCLNRGRFRLELEWRDEQGRTGSGHRAPFQSSDSGVLWFFDEENWEMLVKVTDGCDANGHFWVTTAATTNVEYTLKVLDIYTGASKSYFNPLGRTAPPAVDTHAFATCSARTPELADGSTVGEPILALHEKAGTGTDLPCQPTSTQLCLGRGRFTVEVDWRDPEEASGAGHAVPFATEVAGVFAFPDPQDWQMLVKVINGCSFNGHFWVFVTTATHAEYTLEVTDRQSGEVKSFSRPRGEPPTSFSDTSAFATCSGRPGTQ